MERRLLTAREEQRGLQGRAGDLERREASMLTGIKRTKAARDRHLAALEALRQGDILTDRVLLEEYQVRTHKGVPSTAYSARGPDHAA